MKKDESGISGWCKHTSNTFGEAGKSSRRIINKRVRLNVKRNLKKEMKNAD